MAAALHGRVLQDCLRDALSSVALGSVQAQHTITNHMGGVTSVAHVLQLAKTVTDRVRPQPRAYQMPAKNGTNGTASWWCSRGGAHGPVRAGMAVRHVSPAFQTAWTRATHGRGCHQRSRVAFAAVAGLRDV